MHTGREDEQVLVLELAPQRYAMPIDAVREVLPLATLVQVPQAPSGFAGILRLRGTLLPIIDLRYCLSLPRITPALEHRIIVMIQQGAQLGFQVDAVHGLFAISKAVQPTNGQAGRHHAVERIFSTPEGVIMLLDPQGCISADLREYLASTTFAVPEASSTTAGVAS
jgi:purine-binding chemotaxis protein CheW